VQFWKVRVTDAAPRDDHADAYLIVSLSSKEYSTAAVQAANELASREWRSRRLEPDASKRCPSGS
jgi:hypothetical protein